MLSLESVSSIITEFDEKSGSTLEEVLVELEDPVGQLDFHPLLQALQNSKAPLQALSITKSRGKGSARDRFGHPSGTSMLTCVHATEIELYWNGKSHSKNAPSNSRSTGLSSSNSLCLPAL